MEFVASGVYETKDKKLLLFMGNVIHAILIKNEYLNQYDRKGEAQHTETGEIIDLFEHKDTETVIGITRGLTKVTIGEILSVYQDLESKKIFACPQLIFDNKELKRVG